MPGSEKIGRAFRAARQSGERTRGCATLAAALVAALTFLLVYVVLPGSSGTLEYELRPAYRLGRSRVGMIVIRNAGDNPVAGVVLGLTESARPAYVGLEPQSPTRMTVKTGPDHLEFHFGAMSPGEEIGIVYELSNSVELSLQPVNFYVRSDNGAALHRQPGRMPGRRVQMAAIVTVLVFILAFLVLVYADGWWREFTGEGKPDSHGAEIPGTPES